MSINDFVYRVIAIIAVIALLSFVSCLLWNWIAPDFGLPELSYLKFVGIVVFIRATRSLLFDQIKILPTVKNMSLEKEPCHNDK